MDGQTALSLAYPLGLGLAALGSAFGLGRAVGSAMEAMGRQPEASGKIQLGMIIGCAFIEALTIYALVSIVMVSIFGPKEQKALTPTTSEVKTTAQVKIYNPSVHETDNIQYYIPS